MLICKNGHSFPETDSNSTRVTDCPSCGEKLLESKPSDGTGTLLDSQLPPLTEKPIFFEQSNSIENTLVPTPPPNEQPNPNQSGTKDLQGTLLDSQLLKPESISPSQSKQDVTNDIKTVDVHKTEAINNPNATLEMVPGPDTRIQKKPNLDIPTNQIAGTDPGAPQATLDMVPGPDTRVQKQPNFDIPTNALSNSALEKTGVHQNVKIVSGSQTNPVPKIKSTIRKIVAKAPEGYEIVGELGLSLIHI